MPAQGTDFHDQLVTFFEEADFAFGGEGELEAHFVAAVGFDESVGGFGAGDGGGVLLPFIESAGELLKAFAAEDFVREEGDAPDGDGGEVGVDLFEDAALGFAPFTNLDGRSS